MTTPDNEPNFVPLKLRESFPELVAKIKAADIEVQTYIAELEKENLKLHRIIAKQRVENLSLKYNIQILAEQEAERMILEARDIEKTEKVVEKRLNAIKKAHK
jgi:hypothetical protein